MEEKYEFRRKLQAILELAKEAGGQITLEQVRQQFEKAHLTETQMELVFDYLLSQKVVIKGYLPAGSLVSETQEEQKQKFTPEEEAYLKEYLEDLCAVRVEESGERRRLFELAADGDALAKSRLVELYLKEVVELAKEMYDPQVFLGDMIQEGNVGVLLGVDRIRDAAHAHELIVGEVRQSIRQLIEEQVERKKGDRQMVEKVNALDESIKSLTEELGHKVSASELAVYMGITEEEVEDILRLAGEEEEEETI